MGAAVNGPARCPVCSNLKVPGANRCAHCAHRHSAKGCKLAPLAARDALRDADNVGLFGGLCKCSGPRT